MLAVCKLWKEYDKAEYCHPAYLTYLQSTSCKMSGWMNHNPTDCQEKYQQPQVCRWYYSNGRKWRGTKEPLEEGERGKWKSWLKTQHSKNEESWHPVPSLHSNRRGKVEGGTDFIVLGSKITADGDCSHEIKRRLLLGRKTMTNLDSVLKSRDISLLTKVHIVKAMIFPVVMYGCERWAKKKAEWQRIDAFKLWCWRRLLRGP